MAGTWEGVVYLSGSEPDYVKLTIREDGSYDVASRKTIGASRGKGQIVIKGGAVSSYRARRGAAWERC